MQNIRVKQNTNQDNLKVRDIKDWLRKNPGFAAAVAAEAIKTRREDEDPITDQLKQANDFLMKMSLNIRDGFRSLEKSIGIKLPTVGTNGRIADEDDRQSIMDIVNNAASHKSWKQSATQDISGLIKHVWDSVTTKRGFADLVLGDPAAGGWRASGRRYSDALDQYRKDRWLQDQADGPENGRLVKQYGSKSKADKIIAEEFAKQQQIAREIKAMDVEINRRRGVGMVDDEINSEAGGKLLDKMNELLTQFARYQPNRAGKFLSQDVDPTHVRLLPDDEHFNANQSVHRDYKNKPKKPNVFHVNPAREKIIIKDDEPPVVNDYKVFRSGRDIKPDFDSQNLDIDLTNRGTFMSSQKRAKKWVSMQPTPPAEEVKPNVFKMNPARADAQNMMPVEPGQTAEEIDSKALERHEKDLEVQNEQTGILTEIRDSLADAAKKHDSERQEDANNNKDEGFAGIIADTLKTVLSSSFGALLKGLGGLLRLAGPAAAVAAAGAAGYGAGKLINKGWESLTGNSIGNSLYNVFGDDDKVKDMLEGKPTNSNKAAPMPARARSAPIAPGAKGNASDKLEKSQEAINAIKAEANKKSSTLINAPTTVNQNVNNKSGGSGTSFVIRNQESTIRDYMKSRYQTQ